MGDSKTATRKARVSEKEPVEGVDPNWVKSLLLEIDRSVVQLEADAVGVKRPKMIMVASAGVEEKYVVTSDGAKVESRAPASRTSGYSPRSRAETPPRG